MRFMILFDGKNYFTEPLPEGVNPDDVWDKHPGYSFLDFASSLENAKSKIEADRDRHKIVWY
jgi:hypothetical protein